MMFLFQNTVKYRKEEGPYGQVGDWITIDKCYIEHKRIKAKSKDGDEIISNTQVYIPGDYSDKLSESGEMEIKVDDIRKIVSIQLHDPPIGKIVKHTEVVLE